MKERLRRGALEAGAVGGVLFVTYGNSALSGLLASQGIPHLIGLAKRGYRCHLLTFESHEVARGGLEAARSLEQELRGAGVGWHRLEYRLVPGPIASLADVVRGVGKIIQLVRRHRLVIVHARSYVAGLMACAAAKLAGAEFVFDPRDVLPELMVANGDWRRGGLRGALGWALHRLLCRTASRVIAVSPGFKAHLLSSLRGDARSTMEKRIAVVINGVDLRRFEPGLERKRGATNLHGVFLGTFAQVHLPELVAQFATALQALQPGLIWTNVVYEGGDRMRLVFERAGFPMENLRTLSLRPEEVSGVLQGCDFGVAFFEPRLLWDACPLKVGEYLAAGLPVVVNAGIELPERIVRETGCGVVVENEGDLGLQQAARSLLSLLQSDPLALRASCRASAEKHLSLQTALSQLEAVYRELGAGVVPL